MNGTEIARINGKYSTAFILTYELTGQNISGNYSTFKMRVYGYYGGGTSSGSSYGTVWISGTEYAIGSYRLYPGYTVLAQKDITVYHNNDGSFPYTTQAFAINSYHASGEVSGALSAPSIPRQANVTGFWDFNDEQNPTITYNNPGGFRINARLEFSGVNIRRDNIANTGSYTFNLTDDERKILRQKCTNNSISVRGVIATCIGGTTENYWSYWDKTMTIVNGNPEFSNFTFEDINERTLALTGNNQNVIKGYSNVKVTVPAINKAIAKKEATMNKYRFTCGDKNSSDAMLYSDDVAVTGIINGVPNGTFNVYATDSRNNSTLITKLANEVIDYTPLTKGEIEIGRNNGVSEQVALKFEGQINIVNFGVKTNSVKTAKFRYKSTETGSEWSTPENIEVTINNNIFSFEGTVKGDTENLGFDVANSYEVEVIVEDELSSVTFTDRFGSGTPNLALAKQGVGIMGKYDDEVGGKAQVAGNPLAYYPIGAIYISTDSTNPNVLFGGDWEQIKGRFLLGQGANVSNTTNYWGTYNANTCNFPNGEMGGEPTHTLSQHEMPSHSHNVGCPNLWDWGTGGDRYKIDGTGGYSLGTPSGFTQGGNGSHNNMPPYLVVYIWKRIA